MDKTYSKQLTSPGNCTSPSTTCSEGVNIPMSIERLRSKLTGTNRRPRFDETKTLLFKQGHNSVYSDNILIYEGHSSGEAVFADLLDYEYKDARNLPFSDDLLNMINGAWEDLQKVGWIVIHEHKWGFLLDLDTLEPLYNGQIPSFWETLVKYEFIVQEFVKYAYLHYESSGQNEVNLIPATEFDPEINPDFCPLYQTLFYHQKREVGWMFNLENDHDSTLSLQITYVPFLDTGFYIHNQTKQITIDPLDKETKQKGIPVPSGILASQIGSGKTVSMIGLISIGSQFVTDQKNVQDQVKNDNNHEELKIDSSEKPQAKMLAKQSDERIVNNEDNNIDELKVLLQNEYEPSLIIVTKNILHQWMEEFKKFAPFLRVFLWEDRNDIHRVALKEEGGEHKIQGYDVILTHRKIIEELETIENQNKKHNFRPFLKVKFRRIIIDEIHELVSLWEKQNKPQYNYGYYYNYNNYNNYSHNEKKEDKLDMKKFYGGLSLLQRHFTWGMTGTPNNLNFFNSTELLLKLLNLQDEFGKLNVYREFRNKFLKAHVRANPCSVNLPVLDKSCVQAQFNQIQNLFYQAKLSYSTDENDVRIACSSMLPQYDIPQHGSVDSSVQRAVGLIYEKHQQELERVTKNLAYSPFDERLKHRLKALEDENNFYLDMIEILQKNEIPCPICMCDVEVTSLVITSCVHALCVDCYAGLTRAMSHPMCPICRNYMSDNQLVIHPRFQKEKITKLSAILEEIWKVPEGEKIIIFTQFNELVNKLQTSFQQVGIQYIALKGKPSEINISLRKFEAVPEIKILLISVEQAASGVNITAANHVFFAHPIFGMNVEKAAITYNQCIGRAYRIGQQKPVHVKMFVTKGSIENTLQSYFLNSQLLTF